jgi:hypothetical protein
MNEALTLTATETYRVKVTGDDVLELRARAWDELQKILGPQHARPFEAYGDNGEVEDAEAPLVPCPTRDSVDGWVATQLAHTPNPERWVTQEDGTVLENKDAPLLQCVAEFTRTESGRPTFAG